MLINLLPDFFAVIDSTDRVAAYMRYFEAHRRILESYWTNYVLDPEGPHFQEVVRATTHANRDDLRSMLARIDVVALARLAETESRRVLDADVDTDVVLMVGVGAANAGELVVGGRGMAFIALEHFTGQTNPETSALGLEPELIPLWLAHEVAHAVRYTSPTSYSEMRDLIAEAGGNYDYWETGRRASLRELIINEGIAVQTSRIVYHARRSQAFRPGGTWPTAALPIRGYERRRENRRSKRDPRTQWLLRWCPTYRRSRVQPRAWLGRPRRCVPDSRRRGESVGRRKRLTQPQAWQPGFARCHRPVPTTGADDRLSPPLQF